MKRRIIGTLAAALLAGAALSASGSVSAADDDRTAAPSHPSRGQGCRASYWASHRYNWPNLPGDGDAAMGRYKPGRAIGTIFENTGAYSRTTMLEALTLSGGRSVEGARRALLREATASAINADHEGVMFPWRRWDPPVAFVLLVNEALAGNDAGKMVALASRLSKVNRLGCPLGDTVWTP